MAFVPEFSSASALPTLELIDAIAGVEVLVVGITGTSVPGAAANQIELAPGATLPNGLDAAILDALSAVRASASLESVTQVPAPVELANELGLHAVLAVGLGGAEAVREGAVDTEAVRRAAGAAARTLGGVHRAGTTLASLDLAAAAEGFALGAYEYDAARSPRTRPDAQAAPVTEVALLVADAADPAALRTLEHARAVAEAVAAARDLVNTPPNALYPASFAHRARLLGEAAGLTVDVLDEVDLARDGYGGILGVGQGSSRPPRLVRMTYRSGVDGAKTVALVGKGITFDTGGISIKPAAGMWDMTSDMAGAAAVVATVVLAARLEVAVDVIATVPMAENMPSGTAQRPGDVITQYGGTTVEVLNTDAEGRLVLADAIVRACEDEPDYLIDTATLTGAQMVALGARTPGVLGTDEFRDRVAAISQAVGEGGWPIPMPAEIRKELDSRIADLANITGSRNGGMLAAALFLREFVADGVQWAHLDVAGPAYNTAGAWGYNPKGATGVPVRTMIAAIEDIATVG